MTGVQTCALPISIGGRHNRGTNIDQNFDHYQVEYTFDDGTKFFYYGRTITGCKDEFSSIAHGARGMATISIGGHHLGRQGAGKIFNSQLMKSKDQAWAFPPDKAGDPYENEWDDLMDAIRNNKPYNEVKRGAEASMITSMGRHAAHTGQEITWEDFYNHDHEFAPNVDKLTLTSDSPLMAVNGKYPVPQPGKITKREY